MNGRAASIKSAVADFMVRRGIPGEMEQNLIKEAIHLHLLSALSEAGVLRHVVFQGGTALRLCYGGERYSEDLDFVCGKAGSYIDKIEFEKLVEFRMKGGNIESLTADLIPIERVQVPQVENQPVPFGDRAGIKSARLQQFQ